MRNTPKYFDVQPSANTLILSAVRSIDILFEDELSEEIDAIREQISEHETTNLVIDLGAVDQLGSVTLELLLILWKHTEAGTGKFALCNVPVVGKQVLRTTRLDTLWTISPSREAALAFVRS